MLANVLVNKGVLGFGLEQTIRIRVVQEEKEY
jgi:hypothetical protein